MKNIKLKDILNESTDRGTIDKFKSDLNKVVPKILGSTEDRLKSIKPQPNTFSGSYNIVIMNPFDGGYYNMKLNYPEHIHSKKIEKNVISAIEKLAKKYKLRHSSINVKVGASNAVYNMSIV